MKKSDFKLITTFKVEVAKEYTVDAGDLQDGYQAATDIQLKDISWDNAHKEVDGLIKENILYFKKKRTIERKVVKNSLYKWIEEYFEEDFDTTSIYKCNCFILSNKDLFAKLTLDTAQSYKEFRDKEAEKFKPEKISWELDTQKFIGNIEEVKFKKYAYKKCYLNSDRTPLEKEFETYIDGLDSVEWWYKNGDYGSKHFGIPYWDKQDSKDRMFYPDFIIQYKDKIGIYDTKSGLTLKVAEPKAKVLNKYLSERSNLYGGIITKIGGVWKISGDPFDKDFNKWDDL